MRQRWTRGAVVRIPLADDAHSYAQMLDDPEYAFFDHRSSDHVPPEEAITSAVLFRLWVMRRAHSRGRWPKVGIAPISEELRTPTRRYNQDPLDPGIIRLTVDGVRGPIVTVADCQGFECAAVWEPEHVEDRIADHFARVPNKWALSLRPRSPA